MISTLLLSFHLSVTSPVAHPALLTAAELRKDVEYLASDELGGRGTPSPELDKAAEYIRDRLKENGAVAGNPSEGTNPSFFQTTEYRMKPVHNVIAVVKGSDPVLKNETVLVTAHYDHLGTRDNPNDPGGDKIYNGANDNASGVAGVIGAAKLIASQKPKRTVVFITFWGEERGLLGSSYYAKNPVFPLKSTAAVVNLEQIGRTDDREGPRVDAVSITGFELSNFGDSFVQAGKKYGIGASGHPTNSVSFFSASDNYPFAIKGVPAHTICTAFMFPDYHRASDHADKLDYANMLKVVQTVADGTLALANASNRPQWNENEKQADRYREAAKKLQEDSQIHQNRKGL